MSDRRIAVALAVSLLLVAGSPARAQEPFGGGYGPNTPRPYRGLFGSGPETRNDVLTLGLGFGAGFANERLFIPPGLVAPAFTSNRNGGFGNGYASLRARLGGSKFGAYATAYGMLSYYPNWRSSVAKRHTYELSVWVTPGTRTSIQPEIGLVYRPINDLYSLSRWRPDLAPRSLTPGDALTDTSPQPLLDSGSAGTPTHYLASRAHLSIRHLMNKRTSFFGRAGADRYDYPSHGVGFVTYLASAGMAYTVSKNLAVRLAYGQQFGTYAAAAPQGSGLRVVTRTIDAGLDFDKPISLSQNTTMWLSSGLAVLADANNRARYQIVGDAGVSHQIGRSWNADAWYRRDVRLEGAVLVPILRDGVSAGVQGLLSRRLAVSAWAGVIRGKLAVPTTDWVTIHSVTGAVTTAFSRSVSLRFLYWYYSHEFGTPNWIAAGVAQEIRRNGVSVNLSTSLPVLSRARRSNVAR